MAEQRMRELGRDGGVAWLAERLRRGDVERSMVELAAYCGDRQAREVLGESMCPDCDGNGLEAGMCSDPECCDQDHAEECSGCEGRGAVESPEPPRDFDLWLRGLERWPGALLRAAIAAARATLPTSCCGETHTECRRSCQHEAEVIDAAERWLNDPTEENRKAWDDLWEVAPEPWEHLPTAPDAGDAYGRLNEGNHEAAAVMLGEQRVREAIAARLIEWALR